MLKGKHVDYVLLTVVLVMLSFGTIMVVSASGYNTAAAGENTDAYKMLKKQLTFLALGGVGMLVMSFYNYEKLKKFTPLILIFSFILMGMVFLPGIGHTVNGGHRWIMIGGIGFQPSETMKYAVVLFFSAYLSRKTTDIDKFMKVIPLPGVILGMITVIMFFQHHLSGMVIIAIGGLLVIYIAGIKLLPFFLGGGALASIAVYMAFRESYRLERLVSFLDPFKDSRDTGWQISNALKAIGSGGVTGVGLGRSIMKCSYIPEPHNDFIMAVIAEELGFIGVLGVIILFMIFVARGCMIVARAPTKFGALTAAGITGIITVQALVNLGVVSALLPVTGMALPFFSYGGTALLITMSAVGILLNISRYVEKTKG